MVEVVKLNVGGNHYQVSKTLIEKFPQSTIYRDIHLAEESFGEGYAGTSDRDHDHAIFIDGDGTTFRYVLNYLRHGRVFLPVTETKEGFMNELSHYGLVGKPDEVFTVGGDLKPAISMTTRAPCACTGTCAESCECKKYKQGCWEQCPCKCASGREVAYHSPCDCLGPCGGNCTCRQYHRHCNSRCGCHGRCS